MNMPARPADGKPIAGYIIDQYPFLWNGVYIRMPVAFFIVTDSISSHHVVQHFYGLYVKWIRCKAGW